MGVQHLAKAAFRTNKQSPISQHRQDLPRRQSHKLRLVAGLQNPLVHLVAKSVRHVAGANFSAIDAVPFCCDLPPSALQGGDMDD